MKILDQTPQARVASMFMRHKGYPDAQPLNVEQVADQPLYYFYYQLPEGKLELEVYFNTEKQEWETLVTSFSLVS